MAGASDDARVPFPGAVLPRERWTRTRVGLGAAATPFDWRAAFGRDAPRVVDLGCGNGRYLIASGLARPEVDHLGIDLVPPAIRLASLRAGQRGLANVKFAWGDASEFVERRCAPGALAEVHLYHPQPYFDPTKRARRQLSPRTARAIHRALSPGGLLCFQTDNPAYARYARELLSRLFDWREREAPWSDQPAGRTLREIVARSKGLAIYRAEARRLDLDPADVEARLEGAREPDFDADRPEYTARRRRRPPRRSGRRRR